MRKGIQGAKRRGSKPTKKDRAMEQKRHRAQLKRQLDKVGEEPKVEKFSRTFDIWSYD